jgi:hypothetical protein
MTGAEYPALKSDANVCSQVLRVCLSTAFAGAIAFIFSAPSFADVKVRSYDRGSKTERSIGGKSGKARSSSRTSKNTSGKGRAGRPAPEDDFEPGEVLVTNFPKSFQGDLPGLKLQVIERIAIKKLGVEILRLKLQKGQTVKKAVKHLATKYPSATVDANHRYDLSAATSRMRFPRQVAGWSQVPADCGKGVRFGMIDGAVDVRHPALRGQNIVYRSFHDKTRNPASDAHGTSIATLLIGKPMRNGWSGLLPGAQLFAASMFEIDRQDQVVGNSGGLLKALDWLVSNNVKVVNFSVAGADNKTVARVLKKARKAGMILVASVGNWGYRGKPAYPAGYRDVVAVTATGPRNKIFANANQGRYVDFAAPGEGIWVPVGPNGRTGDGTSFAAPFVTVLAALRVSRGQRADPEIFRRSLRRQTVDLGKRGRDQVFGWGLVKANPTCTER